MRDVVTALVRSIRPCDEIEERHRLETLAWIASGAPLFRLRSPATPPRHLVSYFALVDPTARRVLLVDHRKAGLWLPSGGHVEEDEHPRTTVEREAEEELGISAVFLFPEPLFLTVTETVGSTAGHVDVSLWYVLRGDCQKTLTFDAEEFHRVEWFPLEGLPTRADPHLGRFARKLAARLSDVP